ncbi:MAG: NAD-dependent epimerase/dehydratase [candidate division Zixibacteria bacterium]|nr:NAD-dependent epimerase/dehydratase [candidate division Zixibacteria bacterium]
MSHGPGTVLVTGGAGYIGSLVVALALREGFRVRVLDNLAFGGEAILPYLSHPHFHFVHGDIRSENDLQCALAGVDSIVHLAAVVGDPACRKDPQQATQINKDGAELLCKQAMETGVRRFVFASTCSNYGKMADQNGYVDETSPLAPVSLYAELKVAFERHLLSLGLPEFEPVILRFATAYGLSPRPRFDLTVNEFTRELALNRRLEVFGGQFWRPYAHVADIATACVLALAAEPHLVAYQTFNVGDSTENYQKQVIVRMILEELPEARNLVTSVRRDEDPRDYRVRFEKFSSALGFSITRRVIDGIREIVLAIRTGVVSDLDNPRYRNS